MMKRQRIVMVTTIAAVLLMAFGGVAAQAAGSAPQATAQQATEEPGLVIVSVDAEGPAAAAGVKRGDILLEIDGQETNRARDLLKVISALSPDDEIEIRVLHGDDERTLDLTVGESNGQAYLGLQPYFGGNARDVELTTVETTVPGALITEVVAGSPAEEAGLEVGDLITAVGGEELGESGDLAARIGQFRPGDRVTLEVVKADAGEERSELTVTLGENPDQADKPLLGVRYRAAADSRLLDDEWMPGESPMPGAREPGRGRFPFLQEDGQDDESLTMPEIRAGAVVQSVAADSPAQEAGLQEGDVVTAVDGSAVDTPQDLVDAVSAKEPGDSITLTVERTGEEEALTVKATLGENPDKAGKAYLGVSIGSAFMMLRSHGDTEDSPFFDFELPFDWNNLPFDLDKLPMPFDRGESMPSEQEPA